MGRERGLDEDAVNSRIGVETVDVPEQLGLGGGLGQDLVGRSDPQAGAHALFHAHVDPRSGILAHTQESQGRPDPALPEGLDAPGGVGVELLGDGAPVNEDGRRHQRNTWIDSTSMIGVLIQRWSISSSPDTTTFLPANFFRLMSSLSLCR